MEGAKFSMLHFAFDTWYLGSHGEVEVDPAPSGVIVPNFTTSVSADRNMKNGEDTIAV